MNQYRMYDPSVDAYRTIEAEAARKFVASAKEVEAQLVANGELESPEAPATEPVPEG